MSLTFGTSEADAQLAVGAAGAHWLIELDFAAPVGTLYFTTAPTTVDAGGATYLGGRNISVAPLAESENNGAQQIVIGLPMTDTSMLGLLLADDSQYRGGRVRLYLQLFDAQFAPVDSRRPRLSGRMEPVRTTRSNQADGGTGRIELPCTRSGMPHARNFQGLRMTHAQQQTRYAGSMALQYLQDLIDKPALWLSKRFQELP